MDFDKFCQDYNLDVAPHGHKHQRLGWINVECPFCTGNPGFHLGYEQRAQGTGFVCFRCGGHGGIETISRLAHCSFDTAKKLISEYGGRAYSGKIITKADWKVGVNIKLPVGTVPLDKAGKLYLEKRGFDPEYLVREFDLRQTGPVGAHRLRVVIPIYFHQHIVSYTCRSYAGSEVRYIACKLEEEAIPSKQILYHFDRVGGRQKVVVVEGAADVWRLGGGAVATFGTKVSTSQIKMLSRFRRVILFQDLDEAGDAAWSKISQTLKMTTQVIRIRPKDFGDPGEMKDDEAQYFMRSI